MQRRSGDGSEVRLAASFLEALLAGSVTDAEGVVDCALRAGRGPAAVQTHVIEPAMHRVGQLWEREAITVADEQLATAISHEVLARLFPRLLTSPSQRAERVLLATVEGERHGLGLRMIADVFEGAGFDVLYLGTNVAARQLLAACRTYRPDVVGLSATTASGVSTLIQELSLLQELEPRPAVIAGGQAAGLAIDRGAHVTTVAHSDVVLAVIERLLAEPQAGPFVPERLLRRIANARPGIEAELRAYRDPLTGLWNLRAYGDRIARILASRPRDAAVLIVDVDHLAAANERYGRPAGDRMLAAIADIISVNLRPDDFAARIGGDEFVIVLPNTARAGGVAVADRVRRQVEHELTDPPVTVTVGVTGLRENRLTSSMAVDQALRELSGGETNRTRLHPP